MGLHLQYLQPFKSRPGHYWSCFLLIFGVNTLWVLQEKLLPTYLGRAPAQTPWILLFQLSLSIMALRISFSFCVSMYVVLRFPLFDLPRVGFHRKNFEASSSVWRTQWPARGIRLALIFDESFGSMLYKMTFGNMILPRKISYVS